VNAHASNFSVMKPPAELEGLVTAFHHHHESGGRQSVFRRLPGPFAAVVINTTEGGFWRNPGETHWRPYPKVALHGLFTHWTEAVEADNRSCVMVLLEPWAIRPLFGLAAADAVDDVLDLQVLRPTLGLSLLKAAEKPDTALDAVADVLASVSAGKVHDDLSEPLSLFRLEGGSARVSHAAMLLGTSRKSLWRLFHMQLGVSPKKWCVIERFSSNLRRLHPSPWTDPGAEPDYCDQAHEIREFRRMAGMTPGTYRRGKLAGDPGVFAIGVDTARSASASPGPEQGAATA
jgi:AraC-like DNA-binding protein